jgi:hypothetical protein
VTSTPSSSTRPLVRLEPGEDAQRRRLARARRPEQREELARPDLEVDAVQRGERAVALDDASSARAAPRRHVPLTASPPFTAPTVSP